MIRSFYTATSGALTENNHLNVHSNNIANISTAGFKKAIPLSDTFGTMVLSRVAGQDSGEVGGAELMRIPRASVLDYTSGGFDETGRSLDFAIKGDGYFNVVDANGTTFLTKNGECYLNDQGFLAHARGGLMADQNGEPIYLGNDDFSVNGQGDIYQNGEVTATFGIAATNAGAGLIQVNEGFFQKPTNAVAVETPQVLWKAVERSNVDITDEMTQSIASSRNFQSCSKVMKMIDELTQKTVTEIARF